MHTTTPGAGKREQALAAARRKLQAAVSEKPYMVSRARRAVSIVEAVLRGRAAPIRGKVARDGAAFVVVGGSRYIAAHDGRLWSCSCPDFAHRGLACKHILAVWALARLAQMPIPHPILEDCAGCKAKFPARELQPVEASHLTFFEGDLLCGECVGRFGGLE